MADTELSVELTPLAASQTEISKMEELQDWHERLLRENAESESSEEKARDISLINDFLKSLADAGAVIQYPEYRSQLRALILYWSKFIEEKTETYPLVQLEPFKLSRSEVPNSAAIVNTLKSAIRSVEYDKELTKQLEERLHYMELEKLRVEMELSIANHRLDEAREKWRTLPPYIVTIVATAILSFGTSLVASSPSSVAGWGMVIAGGVLEIVAFLITLTSRPKGW